MNSLLVEDDPSSMAVLERYLKPYSSTVSAADGASAVAAFRTAMDEGKPFDLVCLDIMLPEMDGQSVLKEIRAIEKDHGVAPAQGSRIIMTTALSDKDNLVEAIANCDAYLVKPIHMADLMFYLKRFGLVK